MLLHLKQYYNKSWKCVRWGRALMEEVHSTCKQTAVAESRGVIQDGSRDQFEQRFWEGDCFEQYRWGGCGLNLSPDTVVNLFQSATWAVTGGQRVPHHCYFLAHRIITKRLIRAHRGLFLTNTRHRLTAKFTNCKLELIYSLRLHIKPPALYNGWS